MKFLDRLAALIALPHLALYLVLGQVAVLGVALLAGVSVEPLFLVPELVLEGDWWRVFTFMLMPRLEMVYEPTAFRALFTAFGWYVFWLMGSALETQWGAARFTFFITVGWLLTAALAFLTPGLAATNFYIFATVFLAFARLYPDFEIIVFFILPVKIKWLALLTWCFFGIGFALGWWPTRFAILAAVCTYLLFFARDIVLGLRQGRRRMAQQAARVAQTVRSEPRHRCHVCDKNSDTHPQLDFRYCSKCAGDQCYCPDHLRDHLHVAEDGTRPPDPA